MQTCSCWLSHLPATCSTVVQQLSIRHRVVPAWHTSTRLGIPVSNATSGADGSIGWHPGALTQTLARDGEVATILCNFNVAVLPDIVDTRPRRVTPLPSHVWPYHLCQKSYPTDLHCSLNPGIDCWLLSTLKSCNANPCGKLACRGSI